MTGTKLNKSFAVMFAAVGLFVVSGVMTWMTNAFDPIATDERSTGIMLYDSSYLMKWKDSHISIQHKGGRPINRSGYKCIVTIGAPQADDPFLKILNANHIYVEEGLLSWADPAAPFPVSITFSGCNDVYYEKKP